MENIRLEFYECEHDTDLGNYIDDIVDCGGTIVNSSVDYDDEIGHVEVAVNNRKEFFDRFNKTEAYEFLN